MFYSFFCGLKLKTALALDPCVPNLGTTRGGLEHTLGGRSACWRSMGEAVGDAAGRVSAEAAGEAAGEAAKQHSNGEASVVRVSTAQG